MNLVSESGATRRHDWRFGVVCLRSASMSRARSGRSGHCRPAWPPCGVRDAFLATVWPIPALGGWWITAGIGIRLGTSPRDFLAWLSTALGFNRSNHRADSD